MRIYESNSFSWEIAKATVLRKTNNFIKSYKKQGNHNYQKLCIIFVSDFLFVFHV